MLLELELLKTGPKQVMGGLNLKSEIEVRVEDNRELSKSVLLRTNSPPPSLYLIITIIVTTSR
jgi:hypothetical protein